MAYATMNVAFKARLFWYMAYRTGNNKKRACFGIWLIEGGIVRSELLVIYSFQDEECV